MIIFNAIIIESGYNQLILHIPDSKQPAPTKIQDIRPYSNIDSLKTCVKYPDVPSIALKIV